MQCGTWRIRKAANGVDKLSRFRLHPLITYPEEVCILCQVHINTSYIPISVAYVDVGCSDVQETILWYFVPYKPYDPQNKVIK